MVRVFVRFSACLALALGLVVAVLMLLGLMFGGQFNLIDGLLLSGKPLAQLSLIVLPETLWGELTGLADAPQNPALQSFLSLCAGLGQVGLLLAGGFFRLWYWDERAYRLARGGARRASAGAADRPVICPGAGCWASVAQNAGRRWPAARSDRQQAGSYEEWLMARRRA